jgi:hypothetical protein
MTTQHTPGPWNFLKADNKKNSPWVIRGSAAETLMGDMPYLEVVPENEADWHLIAAAPELLEALKDCLEWMEDLRASGDAGNWEWRRGPYKDGVAAVAKATNE